jgi:hypothetical protein
MYDKCKCCVFIGAKQQTTSMDAFQKLVAEITNKTTTKNTNSIESIQNNVVGEAVRSVNRTVVEKWRDHLPDVIDPIVEKKYIPEIIMHKMNGHFCEGLHHQIHMVYIVTDMITLRVSVIAKNKENEIIAWIQTVDTNTLHLAVNWHTKMVKHFRYGGSEFTDMLNRKCQIYYDQLVTEESVDGSIEGSVDEKEVPHTKAPRIQPLRSTRKLKSYEETDCNENDMKQTVPYFPPSELLKSSKKEKRKRKTGYTRGTYKKRKGV